MIGTNLHDFKILRLLGEGGMGKVYLAREQALKRDVALKVISPKSSEMVERFLHEAQNLAAIDHANVVKIYRIGFANNLLYIAMEYVNGEPLDNLITKKKSETQIWNMALQICYGLNSAWQSGVIHCDIKPSNILVAAKNVVKIADFGLAQKINEEQQNNGNVWGSPLYMSPEQIRNKKLTCSSDIYSLGSTLYEALTQRMLFNSTSAADLFLQHQFTNVNSPINCDPSLSLQTCLILAKMLQKAPQNRYQSYTELIVDIYSLLRRKPLIFATNDDACKIYGNDWQKNKAPNKAQNFWQNLKNWWVSSQQNTVKALPTIFNCLENTRADLCQTRLAIRYKTINLTNVLPSRNNI